jgi:hypothetical protein
MLEDSEEELEVAPELEPEVVQ